MRHAALGLVGLLSLALPGAAEALQPRAADPTSPLDRLAYAEELSDLPEHEEEARDALIGLVSHPVVGDLAVVSLADHCIKHPARPGWIDTYRWLLKDKRVPEDRKPTLEMRLAEGQAADGKAARRQALVTLKRRVAQRPDRFDIRVDYAKALMHARQPQAALAQLDATGSYAGAVEPEIYVLIALGRVDAARKLWQARWEGNTPGPLSEALTKGTREARVVALWRGGYPALAEWFLSVEDGTGRYTDHVAWRTIGDLRVSDGRLWSGHWAYRAALERQPGDTLARQRLVATLLELGDLKAARKYAGDHGPSVRMVDAVERVRAAMLVEDAEQRQKLIAAAYDLAPSVSEVARAHAAYLVGEGADAEAMVAIGPVLNRDPDDAGALWTYGLAAVELGEGEAALARFQEAARRAPDPQTREKLSGDLAGFYGTLGGQQKEEGLYYEAVQTSQIGAAMQPLDASAMMAAGGALWVYGNRLRAAGEEGDGVEALELARDWYHAAWASPGRAHSGLVNAAKISLALGDYDEAERLAGLSDRYSRELEEVKVDAGVARLIAEAEEHMAAGRRAEAMATYQQIIDTWPEETRAWHALADAYLGVGETERALDWYDRVLAVDPANPWVKVGKAKALSQLEPPELDEAEALLATIDVSDFDEPEALQAAVDAGQAAVHGARGKLFQRQGRYREAFEQYVRARQLDPRDPWPTVNLAGLYLENGQPGPALAHYRDILARHPDNAVAMRGEVLSLFALGRYKEARRATEALGLAEDAELQEIYTELQIRARVAELDRMDLWSKPEAAELLLADLQLTYGSHPELHAARGQLAMRQEDWSAAMDWSRLALIEDPDAGRAQGVVIEAGWRGERMQDAVAILESAVARGGGPSTQGALADARFLYEVQLANQQARRGRVSAAEERLDELFVEAAGHTDRLVAVGDARLDLGDGAGARAAYAEALALNRDHLQANLGAAASYERGGHARKAERFLADAYDRTTHPALGAELARLQGARGDWKGAEQTLERLRTERARTDASGRGRDPLPIVPLRDGTWPEDPAPADMEGRFEKLSLDEVDELERRVLARRGPAISAGGGLLHRTGYRGEGWMLASVGIAQLSELPLGPVALHGDALVINVQDGAHELEGGAGSLGMTVPLGLNSDVTARVGTSPVGFEADPYLTWLIETKYRAQNRSSMGLDTGRNPMTDSLTSWGAWRTEDGVRYGGTSYMWVGGWITLRNSNEVDVGGRGKVGRLGAYAMNPLTRRELNLWLGKRFGEPSRWWRLGAAYTGIEHTRQVDGFEPGKAGIFGPNRFQEISLRLDGQVRAEGLRPGLCGGVLAGIQEVAAVEDTLIVDPGMHAAVGMHGTLEAPLGDTVSAGISGRLYVVDLEWLEQSVMLQLGTKPETSGISPLNQVSPIHGGEPSRMNWCEQY